MTCPRCGKEIPNNSVFCNYCSARIAPPNAPNNVRNVPPPQPTKKTGGGKTALIVIIIVIAVCLLGCCGFSSLIMLMGRSSNKDSSSSSSITKIAPENTTTISSDYSTTITTSTTTTIATTNEENTISSETTTISEENTNAEVVNGIRPDVKEAMDSYEAFIDEYVEFMQKYANADSNNAATLLTDYLSYVQRMNELSEKFNALDNTDLTEEEQKYYLEVQLRCNEKLLKASYGISQN